MGKYKKKLIPIFIDKNNLDKRIKGIKIPHGTVAVGDANTIAIAMLIMLYGFFLCRGEKDYALYVLVYTE